MPKRVPVKALADLSKEMGFQHAILFAHDEGTDTHHVVTWGKSVEDCSQAADFGNKMKDALGWPEALHREPPRVKKLQGRLDAVRKVTTTGPSTAWRATTRSSWPCTRPWATRRGPDVPDLTSEQKMRLAEMRFYQRMIPAMRGKHGMGMDFRPGDRELADLGLVENACGWAPFKTVRPTKAGLEAVKDYHPRKWEPGWKLGDPEV